MSHQTTPGAAVVSGSHWGLEKLSPVVGPIAQKLTAGFKLSCVNFTFPLAKSGRNCTFLLFSSLLQQAIRADTFAEVQEPHTTANCSAFFYLNPQHLTIGLGSGRGFNSAAE